MKLALEALSIPDEAERSATWFASFSRQEREALFSPDFLKQVDVAHPAHVFAQYLEQVRERAPLKRMLYADLKIWLPDNLLLRGDQMTMAASIEERVPFLDHKLVELAARIPVRLLTQGFRTKVLLRQALSPYLPEETLQRRKVGFTVPVGQWFRKTLNSFVADLLLSPGARSRDYFNAANMENFVREHFDGVRDRQKQIWALVNFELWMRGKTGVRKSEVGSRNWEDDNRVRLGGDFGKFEESVQGSPLSLAADMRVWHEEMTLAEGCYLLTRGFPKGRALWHDVADSPFRGVCCREHC